MPKFEDRSHPDSRRRRVHTRELAWRELRDKYREEYDRLGALYKTVLTAEHSTSPKHWRHLVWNRAKSKLTERHYDEFIEIRDRIRAEYDEKHPEIAAALKIRRHSGGQHNAALRVTQVPVSKVEEIFATEYDLIQRMRNGK